MLPATFAILIKYMFVQGRAVGWPSYVSDLFEHSIGDDVTSDALASAAKQYHPGVRVVAR